MHGPQQRVRGPVAPQAQQTHSTVPFWIPTNLVVQIVSRSFSWHFRELFGAEASLVMFAGPLGLCIHQVSASALCLLQKVGDLSFY